MANSDLKVRTKDYALAIIRLFSELPKRTETQVIGRQLLRTGRPRIRRNGFPIYPLSFCLYPLQRVAVTGGGAKRITNNQFPLYPLSFCLYPFKVRPGHGSLPFFPLQFDHSSLLTRPRPADFGNPVPFCEPAMGAIVISTFREFSKRRSVA
jgi:hypothetical protein